MKLESSIWIPVDLTFINALVVKRDGLDNEKSNVHLQSKNVFSEICTRKKKHWQKKKILTNYRKVKLESSIWIRVDLTFINALVVISDGFDNEKPVAGVHLM